MNRPRPLQLGRSAAHTPTLDRNPLGAQDEHYDLIIIGGGIQGAATALESIARGLRPLLLERSDFGAATSARTLRIVHGGIRYLQSLDLGRFRESVQQRRWWLRTFPELVRPLPCLMPLDGRGLRRPSMLRAACMANDTLSLDRNRGVPLGSRIPSSGVLSREDTMALFPGCRRADILGGALWHDASMDSPHRLMIEMLRWVAAGGGTALNHVSAREIRQEGGRVTGVMAVDELAGTELDFRASVVVNAAGPWCRAIARGFDRDRADLFHPSLAFNVLLQRQLPASVSVAVAPPRRGAPTYFLRPVGHRTLAGTFHAPWRGPIGANPEPREDQLERFLQDVADAVPDFAPRRHDVVRVEAGLLPAASAGPLEVRRRPVIVEHGSGGGPSGLISVSGIKFTTAPGVARTVLDRLARQRGMDVRWKTADWTRMREIRPSTRVVPGVDVLAHLLGTDNRHAEQIRVIAREEAVTSITDLIERRLDWSLELEDHAAATRTLEAVLPDLRHDRP